jgi:hypothetical protein
LKTLQNNPTKPKQQHQQRTIEELIVRLLLWLEKKKIDDELCLPFFFVTQHTHKK